jgi:sulfide dehydrogenase cytochrome subunit
MSGALMKTSCSLLSLLPVLLGLPQQALAAEVDTHIRTLGSSCITCHGTQSSQTVIPSLAGLDKDYFMDKMKAYQNSDKSHDVMVQHAKGLTETEIEQLAILFSEQSRACNYYRRQPAKKLLEP